MWVLAVAESPTAYFGRIVGRLPGRVMKECAQPLKVVAVEVLLLPAKWCQRTSLGVGLPNTVSLLGIRRSTTLAIVGG